MNAPGGETGRKSDKDEGQNSPRAPKKQRPFFLVPLLALSVHSNDIAVFVNPRKITALSVHRYNSAEDVEPNASTATRIHFGKASIVVAYKIDDIAEEIEAWHRGEPPQDQP